VPIRARESACGCPALSRLIPVRLRFPRFNRRAKTSPSLLILALPRTSGANSGANFCGHRWPSQPRPSAGTVVPARRRSTGRAWLKAQLIEQALVILSLPLALALGLSLIPSTDLLLPSGGAQFLCRAEAGTLRLVEKAGLRLVAVLIPAGLEGDSPPMLLEHSSSVGRLIASKSPVHIPDFAAHEVYGVGDAGAVASMKAGIRTVLFVPMLRNDELIGSLAIGRQRIEHFADKEIELVTDFAAEVAYNRFSPTDAPQAPANAQARSRPCTVCVSTGAGAIALEITRRERQLREVQMELAHANRVATLGQLSASIAHEVKQPIGAVSVNAQAALRWLDRRPPELEEVRQALADIVKDNRRAGDVIGRISDLIKKAPPRKDRLEINGAIGEVIELTRGEAVRRHGHGTVNLSLDH
jgi:hypothetical protein